MPASAVRSTNHLCMRLATSMPALATTGRKFSSSDRWPRQVAEPLLTLDAVSQVFRTRQGEVRAVDDVSLDFRPGQVVCLVGESGSGKTTAAKMAAGLRRPTSGQIRYAGSDIWHMPREKFSAYRRA